MEDSPVAEKSWVLRIINTTQHRHKNSLWRNVKIRIRGSENTQKSSEGQLNQYESCEVCSLPWVVCGNRQNDEAVTFSGMYFIGAKGNYKDTSLKKCFQIIVTSLALSKNVTTLRKFCMHTEVTTALKYAYSIINNDGITTLMNIYSF